MTGLFLMVTENRPCCYCERESKKGDASGYRGGQGPAGGDVRATAAALPPREGPEPSPAGEEAAGWIRLPGSEAADTE